MTETSDIQDWINGRIRPEEIEKYLDKGSDFIPEGDITALLRKRRPPDPAQVRDILAKSLEIETLTPAETGSLIRVKDPDLLREMEKTALAVKKKVYNNRIVTFAPLYTGTLCVNDCSYCGFRSSNRGIERRLLNQDEIRRETEVLAGKVGHKRLIVVYGEHPLSDIDYIVESIRTIYSVREKTRHGWGDIRRANINAPVMKVSDLKRLKEVGIGTYQVFQETYHLPTYRSLHPPRTIKGNYLWRLYCMHRSFEAGVDDVGIGALFGLYDWRFEVLGLVCHARELEKKFGIGPHTVSFPRLEPALNTPFNRTSPFLVSDQDFLKLVTVLRLAIPYTGLILTARESPEMRKKTIELGCTQTDASTRIGVGAYYRSLRGQEEDRQQFLLGDTRSLDELIRELAEMGYITSFCTAGYRCGRTGKRIMDLLKSGREGGFCKLNAVLTFREWLDDFAGPETKKAGEVVLRREMEEIKKNMPDSYPQLRDYYNRIRKGERDLYF